MQETIILFFNYSLNNKSAIHDWNNLRKLNYFFLNLFSVVSIILFFEKYIEANGYEVN